MTNKPDQEIDDFTLQTVMTILHIMRNLRSAGIEMTAEVELSYPQMLALFALQEKSPATMSELARWLRISHGVATRLVDRLVEKGLVERRRDEEDRRVVFVSLSKEGAKYSEHMMSYHLEKIDSVFKTVRPEQREAFLELLDQVNKQLEE